MAWEQEKHCSVTARERCLDARGRSKQCWMRRSNDPTIDPTSENIGNVGRPHPT